MQSQSYEDFDKIVQFVYRDKLFSCLSNFAYAQSQKVLGFSVGKSGSVVSSGDSKIARKWLQLEDRAR